MEISLGSFVFVMAKDSPDLIASPVAAALNILPNSEVVGACEIDPSVSDTANFCEKYQMTPDKAANCVIVSAKQGEERVFAACVVLASTRIDVNKKVSEFLKIKRVSFAPMEKAVEESGMEFGAITPIGLPASWPILIDKAVVDSPYVIIGSGLRKSKLAVPGAFLATLPNATVIEGLGLPRV